MGTQSSIPKLGSEKTMQPPSATESMAFESSIDPTEYHLGPGDVLQCRFWTSGDAYYPVISSDNMLLIPNLGAFDVRGKTLAEIQTEVLEKANESFARTKSQSGGPPITLALYQPRKIYVKVEGDVAMPGLYALSSATRADLAVDLANHVDPALEQHDPGTEKQREMEENGKKHLESIFGEREVAPASERYITVTHGDGTSERVDLVRYNSTHDPKAAPPLREGDVILVPFRDLRAPSLGVYGAVQAAGDFEFVRGDSLSAAIRYAFGPSADADLHHVEVTRLSDNGSTDPTVYDLSAIVAHRVPDVALEPNDRIVVRFLPESHKAAVVAVRGEVAEPGVYPITDGQTTLSEVIREAGGLTPAAYPTGGEILRHGSDERLTAGTPEEISKITRLENLGVSDTINFQRQMSIRPPVVVTDMDRLFVQNDHSQDVTLRDGDEIEIPKQPTTVYVYGFVNNAGYVQYQEGASLKYYISQAGGYANGADKSQMAVIKLRTKAWMDPSDTKIEPGDEIFIPKVPDLPENYTTQNIQTIAGLVFGLGGLITGLYLTFLKK